MKKYETTEQAFELRPASIEEAGLFYSDEEKDKALGTVGHLRMDFGSGGNGFHHSWWPHNEDRFNTLEFKESLQEFVDAMRQNGPLRSLAAMNTYCWHHGGGIAENDRIYGYIAETEHYKFCLRCTPRPGDYQGYLYCYDLRQQEMSQQDKMVGRVSYADGTTQEFADSQQYLRTIKEELPFRNTTGFRHETLTDDPEIRKAVDDILLNFAGEENPRRTCNYGLTEKGLQALRDVADPSLPHTYAWFVMTECNTPQEQLYRNLTMKEAVELYVVQNSELKKAPEISWSIPPEPNYAVYLQLIAHHDDLPFGGTDIVELKLPAKEDEMEMAVRWLGNIDWGAVECTCLDCKVPALAEHITSAVPFETIERLGDVLAQMSAEKLPVYKALIEATECQNVECALGMAEQLDEYILSPSIASPEDAATEELSRILPEQAARFILPHINLHNYGLALLESRIHAETEYGLLERRDNQPIQCVGEYQPEDQMEEMTLLGYVFLLWERLLVGKGYSSTARRYGCL